MKRKKEEMALCLVKRQTKAKKRTLSRNGIGQHLDLRLSASRTLRKKCLLFKSHTLWYLVLVA